MLFYVEVVLEVVGKSLCPHKVHPPSLDLSEIAWRDWEMAVSIHRKGPALRVLPSDVALDSSAVEKEYLKNCALDNSADGRGYSNGFALDSSAVERVYSTDFALGSSAGE